LSRPMKAMERFGRKTLILLRTSLGARRDGLWISLWALGSAARSLLPSTHDTSHRSWLVGLQSCHSRLQRRYRLTRNHKLLIENDIHSHGVSAKLTMSHPSTDTAATFPHDITKTIPFSSLLIRERRRPESSLTTAELYFILAMAGKHAPNL